MSDLNQTDLVDGMIARLERANASAYERFTREGDGVVKSAPDVAGRLSAQQGRPVMPRRAMTPLIVLLALLLAVSAGVVTVAREPFLVDGAQFFARWANLWRARAASSPQLTPQAVAASASPISFEVPERLHKMEVDLANVAQQIEQIKVSQEQIIRRDAALSDRFKASEEQLIRD